MTFDLHLPALNGNPNLHVGILTRHGGGWAFRYTPHFKAQTEVAPITNFPNVNREYESKRLWPFFQLRIPSRNQPGVQTFLNKLRPTIGEYLLKLNGVDHHLLQKFGRFTISNPFELVPRDRARF